MTEGEKNTSDSGAGPTQAGAAADAAVPWYRRPFFWGMLFFLLLLVLAAWLVWKQWQVAEQHRASLAAQTAESRKRNDALDAFLQKLRLLLKKDPCVIQRELGSLEAPPGVDLRVLPAVPPLAPSGGSDAFRQLPAAPARKPESVAELLEQATVLILAQRPEGLSMGSGFFVAPGYIVTNGHVVGNATEALVINKATRKALRAAVLRSTQSGGRDFAVLTVDGAPAITPLKLAGGVKRTERVSAWGFPGAITTDDPKFAALLHGNAKAVPEVVYTDGAVSVILQRKPPLIVHTATVSQGNSGGPLVNERGEVVGINTFIKLDDESYRQSSLAIVSDSLADYLRSVQVPFSRAAARPAGGEKP